MAGLGPPPLAEGDEAARRCRAGGVPRRRRAAAAAARRGGRPARGARSSRRLGRGRRGAGPHRVDGKTGEEVAVKIQYPGIARTIREDIRNLLLCMLPGRLSREWESTKEQLEDLRVRLERETDYEQEAASLERVRALFHEDDGIVVPRVYPQYSTARVLTMERLPGMHLEAFLATNPSQELRNEFARKITRAWYRMLFAGRMLYIDNHPGNFLFMDDGRLGVIDFGLILEMDDTLWEFMRKVDRPLTTGERDERIAFVKEWSWISDDPSDQDRLRLSEEFADWNWRARYCGGEFDFGDEADFRRRRRFVSANGPQTLHPHPPLHNVDYATNFRLSIDLLPAEGEVRHRGDCGRGSACDRVGPQRLRAARQVELRLRPKRPDEVVRSGARRARFVVFRIRNSAKHASNRNRIHCPRI